MGTIGSGRPAELKPATGGPTEVSLAAKDEPLRATPAPEVSARYAALARTGTLPEIQLRRALHRRRRRFRIHTRIEGLPRRRVDIAFSRWKVCVLVDGCFWHSCPMHGSLPRTNQDWWAWKLARTKARDEDTDERLHALGWMVVRVWEHLPSEGAADLIEEALVAAGAPGRPRERTQLCSSDPQDPGGVSAQFGPPGIGT